MQSGAYLGRKFRLDHMYYIIITCMELKISHGIIEGGGEGLRGSLATEQGEGVGGGFSPSHGWELFHFST